MAKHRHKRTLPKNLARAAAVGGALATATAMTVTTAVPANALALPGLGEVSVPVVDDLLDGTPGDAPGLAALPVVGDVLGSPLTTTISGLLSALGVTGVSLPGTLGNIPIRIITTGPPFTLARLFGVDIGYTPAIPSLIADRINSTPYARVGIPFVLDLGNVRVPIVVAFGLGAFATGLAYPSVVADLENQPGGENYQGPETGAGSITILPMILLRNPGRPNGGLFARADPLAQLFGFTTVTPPATPEVSTGDAGSSAVLLPIKIDATVEYDPLSDFPSWPNPVSLLNSGAALLFPTYILRGSDVTGIAPQLAPLVPALLQDVLAVVAGSDDLAPLEVYLTIPENRLPLLEPARLPFDVINLFTGSALSNPFADAIEPALKILVNLGYTDVDQANGYVRTLDDAGTPTPFFTLPDNVNWDQVPDDVINALVSGFEAEFGDSQNPFIADPGEALPTNAFTTLLSLLGALGSGGSLTDGLLGGLLNGPLGDLTGTLSDASVLDTSGGPEVARTGGQERSTLADLTPTPGSDGADDQLLTNLDGGGDDDVIDDVDDDDDTTLLNDGGGTTTGIHGATPVKPRQTLLSTIHDITHNAFQPFGHRNATVQDDDGDNGTITADEDDTDMNDDATNVDNDDDNSAGSTSTPADSNTNTP